MTDQVFSVRYLRVSVRQRRGLAAIVNGVDLRVERGRTLAVVGESGSGKSMTMLAATGLTPPGVSVDGSVRPLRPDPRTPPCAPGNGGRSGVGRSGSSSRTRCRRSTP